MHKPEAEADESRTRLPAGRKSELVAYVAEVGQVTVASLAERFGVSIDTIRRDLDELDGDGVLIRTYGGAVSVSATRGLTRAWTSARLRTEAKEKIGALAATLVRDGSVIILNGGTTTLSVARSLHEHRDLTIATNNLRIPAEISPKSSAICTSSAAPCA